ncbi:MAG: GTPase Era, partial [Candidatus Aminicenantes bacterium]|nr:GTPase Era [Candidatus Aminicenantes bacterium]
KDTFKWAEIVPISALNGNNIDLLEELLYKYLPEGEYLFPDEQYTLQSEKFYTAEIIREKILHITRDEIPYTTSVKVEEIDKKENVVYIRAEIYVETNSQKKILIGKKGNLVKNIGAAARKELEEYFEFKVFLDLFIKVVPGWRNSIQVLQEIEFY